MLKALMSLILTLFGWVLSLLLEFLQFPSLPPEFIFYMAQFLDVIRSGLGILNFIIPLSMLSFLMEFWFAVFAVKEVYIIVMWVLRKTPFLGIK